jgi:hypothetical protein
MEKEVLFRYEQKTYSTIFHRDSNEISEQYSSSKKPRKNGRFTYLGENRDEEVFVKNFANKLTNVSVNRHLIVIEKYDNKVSLKYFNITKNRNAGNFYFSEKKNLKYVTFNLKTNDIYVGSIEGYQRKVKSVKRISKNPFKTTNYLMNSFNSILSVIPANDFDRYECFKVFKNHIGCESHNSFYDVVINLSIKYYTNKGVKIPNNFNAFITSEYSDIIPSLKVIRKHKNKFIDAFMTHNKISGNEVKKQLHLCDSVRNIHGYKSMLDIFGYNRLRRSNLIKTIIESSTMNNYWGVLPTDLSSKQTDTLFNYFTWLYEGLVGPYTFSDHFRYYEFLRAKGENISFKATNIDEFINEHSTWSVMESSYRKGVVTRQYPQHFYNGINKSISSFDGGLYFPVLLINSYDYENESATQNNCVRGYVDKSNCFIVSLREGSEDSLIRATIEYRLSYDNVQKRIIANRVQSLGKYNGNLGSSWDTPLEILDKRVDELMKLEFTISCKTNYQNGKIDNNQLVVIFNEKNEGEVSWDKSIFSESMYLFDF